MKKNENKNKIEKQQMFSSLILRNSNKLKANYFYSYFQGYKRGYEKINNIKKDKKYKEGKREEKREEKREKISKKLYKNGKLIAMKENDKITYNTVIKHENNMLSLIDNEFETLCKEHYVKHIGKIKF